MTEPSPPAPETPTASEPSIRTVVRTVRLRMHPASAGVLLGLALAVTAVVLGYGLDLPAALARILQQAGAPGIVPAQATAPEGAGWGPLLLVASLFTGAFITAVAGGRLRLVLPAGWPAAVLALAGGLLAGAAAALGAASGLGRGLLDAARLGSGGYLFVLLMVVGAVGAGLVRSMLPGLIRPGLRSGPAGRKGQ